MTTTGKFVTRSELAKIFGVTERTISAWGQDESFPVTRIGAIKKRLQFDTKEVIDWYVQREVAKLRPNGKLLDPENERALLWRAQRLYNERRTEDINAEVARRTSSAIFTAARVARDH